MKDIPLEKMLPRADGSVYMLSRLASKRCLELADGKKTLLDKVDTDKIITITFEEIEQARVVSSTVKDQLASKESESNKEGQESTS